MLDQSRNLGSSPSCPTTKLYDLGQKSMVSAFLVVQHREDSNVATTMCSECQVVIRLMGRCHCINYIDV